MDKMQAINDQIGTAPDDFLGVVEDVIDRALSMTGDVHKRVCAAMDDGLIYDADQWAMIEYYCRPSDANFQTAWEALMNDCVAIIEAIEADEDEDDGENDDRTADEVAYDRYLNGECSYNDYANVCREEGTESKLPGDDNPDDVYEVRAYYDDGYRGLASSDVFHGATATAEAAWDHVQKGLNVNVRHSVTGKTWKITPDFEDADSLETMLADLG